MKLQCKFLWSPDLVPPSEGMPNDPQNFDVFMQVAVEEVGKEGHEVFDFRVCSAAALSATPTGTFVSALVLHRFDWAELRKRMDKLLLHTTSCPDWKAAIAQLNPYLHYSDAR